MITLLFKELRENIKWAAMLAGVFCVLILFRTRDAEPFFLYDLTDPITMLYAPLAGLAMGFVQSFFETRPDNWAFVVHRPVSRRRIFAAKCIAGLALLYFALALPCLLAVIWAIRPGNVPMPLQARMVQPMFADILSAGCYYFVGIILTLRKARWFGTRLLPVGLAFLCSVLVRLAPQFWHALACIAVGQLIGALAAWDVFATAGVADKGGAPGFSLGAMIYSGMLTIACLWGGVLGIFDSTIQWHDVRMDKQGNVLRVTKTLADDELIYLVTDVEGHALAEYDGIDLGDPASASQFVNFSPPLFDDRQLPWPMSTMSAGGYRSARDGIRSLRSVAPSGVRANSMALFDVQERLIDLYDPLTRVLIGRVGPAGFSPETTAPAVSFPGEPLNGSAQPGTRTLAFGSVVYWMALNERKVTQVFHASDDDPVVAAHDLPPATDPSIIIATRGRLIQMRPSGEVLFSIPFNLDLGTFSLQAATLPPNHHVVLRVEAILPELADSEPPRFLEYSADGALIRQSQPAEVIETSGVTLSQTALFGLTYPLTALPVHHAWIIDSVFGLDSQHHRQLFLGCILGGSVLSLLGTFLLCRRYGFAPEKTARWCAINLLIGPAGIAALVGLNERPAREVCAACLGRRLADRPACQQCGAAPARPAFDGREVFEPADIIAPLPG